MLSRLFLVLLLLWSTWGLIDRLVPTRNLGFGGNTGSRVGAGIDKRSVEVDQNVEVPPLDSEGNNIENSEEERDGGPLNFVDGGLNKRSAEEQDDNVDEESRKKRSVEQQDDPENPETVEEVREKRNLIEGLPLVGQYLNFIDLPIGRKRRQITRLGKGVGPIRTKRSDEESDEENREKQSDEERDDIQNQELENDKIVDKRSILDACLIVGPPLVGGLLGGLCPTAGGSAGRKRRQIIRLRKGVGPLRSKCSDDDEELVSNNREKRSYPPVAQIYAHAPESHQPPAPVYAPPPQVCRSGPDSDSQKNLPVYPLPIPYTQNNHQTNLTVYLPPNHAKVHKITYHVINDLPVSRNNYSQQEPAYKPVPKNRVYVEQSEYPQQIYKEGNQPVYVGHKVGSIVHKITKTVVRHKTIQVGKKPISGNTGYNNGQPEKQGYEAPLPPSAYHKLPYPKAPTDGHHGYQNYQTNEGYVIIPEGSIVDQFGQKRQGRSYSPPLPAYLRIPEAAPAPAPLYQKQSIVVDPAYAPGIVAPPGVVYGKRSVDAEIFH